MILSQKNTMYIIASSMKFKARALLSKELSLLFGNFEVVTIEPFDISTSEQYLSHRMQGASLNPAYRDFIVHFTGGYPFYLETIVNELAKADQRLLADILEALLFDVSGILNQRFSNYMKRFQDLPSSNDYVTLLYLVASGHNKIKDIGHLLKKPAKQLQVRINRLLELDTIVRNGDFLRINDRVFGFWLRFVYQEKMQAFVFDAKTQKAKFRDSIEDMIQEFMRNARKPVIERVSELLRLFADDTIQVERKKLKLTHFREIKPLEFGGEHLRQGLLGRSHDSLWILGFKNDQLTEEDISEFSRECKKYRHKLQRKIMVSLRGIDTNARLKALEEKVWMWDINNLNQFFDLYSKPRVIA